MASIDFVRRPATYGSKDTHQRQHSTYHEWFDGVLILAESDLTATAVLFRWRVHVRSGQ
jgi:hypothetical protein